MKRTNKNRSCSHKKLNKKNLQISGWTERNLKSQAKGKSKIIYCISKTFKQTYQIQNDFNLFSSKDSVEKL